MNTLESEVENFLLACQADGLSVATIKWYRGMLAGLTRRWPAALMDDIDANHLRKYLVDLRTRSTRYPGGTQKPEQPGGLSAESVRAHIRAMKRFFNWYWIENDLSPATNPSSKIRMPPRRRAEPKAIALDDLRALILACDETPIGLRNRALLYFLADTGARAGGVLSLTWDNLYISQGRAIVTEKGDRTRAIPFTPETARMLMAWQRVSPLSDHVFCNMTRNKGEQLTNSGLNEILLRLKIKAKVKGRVNPHSFRHGFAREYLRNGGDLGTLAQIMGHTNISVTTDFYAVYTGDELAVMHGQYSPIQNIKGNS